MIGYIAAILLLPVVLVWVFEPILLAIGVPFWVAVAGTYVLWACLFANRARRDGWLVEDAEPGGDA